MSEEDGGKKNFKMNKSVAFVSRINALFIAF